jgi:transcriptional regulator with GAF, ATPase, and Fis domain
LLKENDIEELKKSGAVSSIGESAKVWLGVPLKIEDDVIGVFVVQSYDNENAFTEEIKKCLNSFHSK